MGGGQEAVSSSPGLPWGSCEEIRDGGAPPAAGVRQPVKQRESLRRAGTDLQSASPESPETFTPNVVLLPDLDCSISPMFVFLQYAGSS